MKSEEQLPRLSESTTDDTLRRALGAAERDLPGPDRMKALSAGFSAKLGAMGGAGSAGAAGSGSAAAPAAGASGAVVAKVTGVIVAIVVAGAIVNALRPKSAPPTQNQTPVAVATPSAAVSIPVAEPAAPDPIPTVSVAELPELAPKAKPSAEPAAPRESDLSLLHRAQDALGSNPAQALSLCSELERNYPRSPYAQEREVIAIDALIRLGRRSEAQARADRFERAFPSSGHNRRIDSLLGR